MLMRIYINHNLWRYERSFNPTSIASPVASSLISPPSSPSPAPNYMQPRRLEPLKDVGPIDNAPSKYRNTDPSHICPSPPQRDVGGSTTLNGGVREGWTRGETQAMRGPRSTSQRRGSLSSLPLTTPMFFAHVNDASMRERGPNDEE